MNRNLSISIILIFTLFALGTASCVKNNGAAKPSETLVGTWRETEHGYDNNGDGIIESYELVPDSVKIQQYQFNDLAANGYGNGVLTFGIPGNLSTVAFKWYVNNATDSIWVGFSGHDTLVYYLYSVSSSTLTLTTYSPKSTGAGGDIAQMYIFNKQ